MLHRFIDKSLIFINPTTRNKKELFHKITQKALEMGLISATDEIMKIVEEKEKTQVMELKPHFVFPHVRSETITKLFVIIVVSQKGIPYEKAKKNMAQVVLFAGIPKDDHEYLKLLAAISRLFSKEEFVNDLLKSQVEADVIYNIRKYSFQAGIINQNPKKNLVVLILNTETDNKKIASYLMEIGIEQPTMIDGENLGNVAYFIPFLSMFGGKGFNKYNHVFLGISDDDSAASRLNEILLSEGINVRDNGVGSLFQVSLADSYGGFGEDILL